MLSKEYVANFANLVGPTLQGIVAQLESPSLPRDTLATLLSQALTEFVGLRAAAAFLGAKRSERIADEMVRAMEAVIDATLNRGHLPDVSVLLKTLKLASAVFDAICQLVNEFCTEEMITTDPNLKDLLHRLAISQERLEAASKTRGHIA